MSNSDYNKVVTFTLDGETVRARDAVWIVFNPEKKAVDYFASDIVTRDNVARAARSFFKGDTAAILALNEGWHVRLVGPKAFLKQYAAEISANQS